MKRALLLILFIVITIPLISQNVELNRVNAKEEFMWGVKFFNQGLFEKAVFSFEKSLSYDSKDFDTHLWLGKAYYMKGDTQAALKEWDLLKQSDLSPLWLDNMIDVVNADIGVVNKLYIPGEWITHYKKEISRPISILPLTDGTVLIVSFLSNRITRVNMNGAIIETFNGGVEEFNRPFDIIAFDNSYLVSEFMGDKLSIINDLGIKVGEMVPKDYSFSGPGFMTLDNRGYIYVTDWGNKRVVKFDQNGTHILSIEHEKIKAPSGIVSKEDSIYVSDQLNGYILEFDQSGNYKSILVDKLESPEGLSIIKDQSLLIADGKSVKEFLFSTNEIRVVSNLEGKGSRITKAVYDLNGNTLVSDFNLGSFYSLTDINSLHGGLFVTIDRINSVNYPDIQIEVNVKNRFGNPVVGLDNSNFLISEASRVLPKRDVVYRGNDNEDIFLSVILDFDSSLKDYYAGYYDILETIENERRSSDRINIIQASSVPVILNNGGNLLDSISSINPGDFTLERGGIDQAIKLSSSTLIQTSKRREILLITDGNSKNSDFAKYSLDEISSSLRNNRTSLTVLYLTREKNEELEYIIEKSGGSSRFLFSDKGVKGVLDTYRKKLSGYYIVNYTSLSEKQPGEQFIPVEAEVNYIRKSGRSESGYFSPIKITK